MTDAPSWATLVRADNPGPMTLDGTNTWLLDSGDGNVVVDPGPLLEEHLQAVLTHGPVASVVFTHHHADHAECVDRFAELTAAPARALDPALCRHGGEPLANGDRLAAGELTIDVLTTPGHTADSICLAVAGPDGARVVLTGDSILGRGTTVVAHPDGNLGDYLSSLQAIRELGDIPVLPGHGPVLPSASQVAQEYLDHREQRLEQVRAALDAGDSTAEQVVDRVYADVDPAVRFAALMSVQAQLDYLHPDPTS